MSTYAQSVETRASELTERELETRIREIGPWFHNLRLQGRRRRPRIIFWAIIPR